MRRWRTAIGAALAGLALWGAVSVWQRSALAAPRASSILYDHQGRFMAQIGGGAAGYGYWPVEQVPPRVTAAILALEDRRFWSHPGVDPGAALRALWADLHRRHHLLGASTLAMQVARMQHPEARTVGAKLMEAATALVMTARYGHEAVLRQYLCLVPFGQNSHGIAHAARWYFDKPPTDLSWAEIAFLSAIPQSPGVYNPSRPSGLVKIKKRAALALDRLYQQRVFNRDTYQEAQDALAQLAPRQYPDRAPEALHAILATAQLAQRGPAIEQLHSTIDLPTQIRVSDIAHQELAALRVNGARQVAVILTDRTSMEVRALVGSDGYGKANDGMIDYAMRWRSPGSTLKPFIFAQALDHKTIAPDTMLSDDPDSGTGVDNADNRFLGPMLPRQALANSRNVPAAALVRLAGLDRTHWFLTLLGLHDDAEPSSHYGLNIAVGDLPTKLTRLVAAYGTLANQGRFQPLRWYREQSEPDAKQVLTAPTSQMVTLYLSDPMARLPSFARMGATEFPFPVAVKTGTSQSYRDAWVVEYTDDYVIGVWVGRPDGAAMNELGGAASAALVARQILLDLYHGHTDGLDDRDFPAPSGTRQVDLCASGGAGHCAQQIAEYVPAGAVPKAAVESRFLLVASPLNHDTYIRNPDTPPDLAVLPLRAKASADVRQVEWYVDGREYQVARAGDTVQWPVVPGLHRFAVGVPFTERRSASVEVMVK